MNKKKTKNWVTSRNFLLCPNTQMISEQYLSISSTVTYCQGKQRIDLGTYKTRSPIRSDNKTQSLTTSHSFDVLWRAFVKTRHKYGETRRSNQL